MATPEKRRIFIFINDKEVENSLKSMTKEARKLRNEFAATSDPKEQKRLAKELQNVEKQVVSLKNQAKGLGGNLKKGAKEATGTFTNLKKTLQSNTAAIFGWTAAIGIAIGVLRDGFKVITDFDESVADLAKTTGLAKEEARDLALEVIKIDTRTPVTQLLELATAAGRLGLSGEDVIDFTRQADRSFVALRDSLEGSAEEIGLTLGKLASNFDLEKKFGIGESLNKIGSALNELGANSKATEGPIVDFTKRLSGVAAQAKISAPDIMALGALFDESGQSIEVASTTFNKLLPAIGKDVSKFAEIAGIDVKEFKKIVEEDAFEALKLVAEGAKSNQKGLIGLTDTLENYGIESARAASIVGILSSKTDRLTELQEISNSAFEEGTSLANEFALKNDTVNAKLDILGNRYDRFIIGIEDGQGPIADAFKGMINDAIKLFDGIELLTSSTTSWENKFKTTANAISSSFDLIISPMRMVLSGFDKLAGTNLAESFKVPKFDIVVEEIDKVIKATEGIVIANEEVEESVKELSNTEKAEMEKSAKAAEKKAEKELKAFEKLNEKIAELREELVIKGLEGDQAEIANVKKKYDKLIKEAGDHKDQVIALEALKTAEIAHITITSNKAMQDEIDEFNRSHFQDERQIKINQIEDEFQEKLDKIKGNSEEEIALRKQLEDQKKQVLDDQKAEFDEEDKEKSLENRQIELENQLILAEEDFEARKLILEEQRQLELSQEELTQSEIDVINKKYDDIERKDYLKQQDFKLKILKGSLDTITKLLDASSREKLKQFDREAEAELESFSGTKEQKKSLENKLDNEREKLEKEIFDRKKKLAIISAVIDTASSVVKTLSSVPYPASIPLALLAGLQGAAQIKIIKSETFAEGGFTGDGFGSADSSGFKQAGIVHQDEWVAPAWMTESPMYADTIGMLETARRSGRGYAEGGSVESPDDQVEEFASNSDNAAMISVMTRLADTLDKGIKATSVIDQNNLLDIKEGLDEITEIEAQ